MKITTIRRRIAALFLCAALTLGALTLTAGAVNTSVTAQLSPNVSVYVDGVARTFYNANGEEVHPINYGGSIYLPLRAIGELMDKNVNWDQASLTVTLSGTRTGGDVAGTPDADAAVKSVTALLSPDVTVVVDGVVRTFTDAQGNVVYPINYNGSLYLPVRAIGNLMGKNVGWDSATKTVTLSGELLVTDADSFNQGGATQPGQTTSDGLITEETAKSKALSHAGLRADQVTFIRSHLDYDDGRQVYDVEFYTADYTEYDYEIDARTGEVLSFDYDAEYYQPTRPSGDASSYIGLDEAKRIALSHVSGAAEANIRSAHLDYDDGRAEYEIEIIYGTTEYDFEIDAVSGAVISQDMDSIYD